LHHRGLIIDNYDLRHSRKAENISELRKGKHKRENYEGLSTSPFTIIQGTASP
ncbi:MAG: hypothetical protein QOG51_79, partial [Verrucomicrobiota bacterium]